MDKSRWMKQALLFLFFTLFSISLSAQSHLCEQCPATPGANSGNYPYLSEELEQPTVFPNPAIDFISLKNPGTVQTIRIYNLVGRQLLHFQVEAGKRYPVSDLPRGMYLVQMVDQSQNVIKTQRINKRWLPLETTIESAAPLPKQAGRWLFFKNLWLTFDKSSEQYSVNERQKIHNPKIRVYTQTLLRLPKHLCLNLVFSRDTYIYF